MEKVIPELVDTEPGEQAWKSIEYSHLVPILIEAIKQLNENLTSEKLVTAKHQKEIDVLKAQIDEILSDQQADKQ